MSFQEYLNDKFMLDEPTTLDDDLPDAYDKWIAVQDTEEIVGWAEDWRTSTVQKKSCIK